MALSQIFFYDPVKVGADVVLLHGCPQNCMPNPVEGLLEAVTRLKPVWNDRSISLIFKIRLVRSLVTSIFLYACES